jgi:hypothetical protein
MSKYGSDHPSFGQTQEQEYTVISWANPDSGLPQPGWFQALDMDKIEVTIPGESVVRFQKNGNQTPGIFAPELELACIARRFVWEKSDGGNKQYATGRRETLPDGGAGWHGRTHVFAFVRDADGALNGPVVLTFKGWAGTRFEEAVKAHDEAVKELLKAAREDPNLPPYLFTGRYFVERVSQEGSGQKSPVAAAGCRPIADLDEAYIGEDVAAQIAAMAEEIRVWTDAWRNGGNGNGVAPTQADGDKPAQGPDSSASEAQWSLVRKLLAEIGVEGKEAQNDAIRKAGFDPDNLTMGKASEAITRLQARKNGNGAKANGK